MNWSVDFGISKPPITPPKGVSRFAKEDKEDDDVLSAAAPLSKRSHFPKSEMDKLREHVLYHLANNGFKPAESVFLEIVADEEKTNAHILPRNKFNYRMAATTFYEFYRRVAKETGYLRTIRVAREILRLSEAGYSVEEIRKMVDCQDGYFYQKCRDFGLIQYKKRNMDAKPK